jgi:hypothetical protein
VSKFRSAAGVGGNEDGLDRVSTGFLRLRRPGLLVLAFGIALLVGSLYPLLSRGARSSRVLTTSSVTDTSAPSSTSSSTPPTTAGRATTVPLTSVDWSSMTYPVNCGGQTTGSAVAYPSPQPGTQLAIVLVSCVAGAGSPPSAALVYDGASSSGSAHLRQMLITYQDDWIPNGTMTNGPRLDIPVYGYSSTSVGRCCPDIHLTLSWAWNGTGYVETNREPSHSQLPSPG